MHGGIKDDISEEDKEVARAFEINKFSHREAEIWSTRSNKWEADLSPVIDNIIHIVTANCPKPAYFPGFALLFRIFSLIPTKWFDSLVFGVTRNKDKGCLISSGAIFYFLIYIL